MSSVLCWISQRVFIHRHTHTHTELKAFVIQCTQHKQVDQRSRQDSSFLFDYDKDHCTDGRHQLVSLHILFVCVHNNVHMS